MIAVPCAAQDEETNPYAGDTEAAQEGQALFARSGCVPCHGPEAEGGIGPNLVDDVWIFKFSPGMVYRTIRYGRRGTPMVSFKDRLTPEQTWKIVEFLLARNRELKAKQGK
ncbi:MAG TPA: c-type cytochrome [Burkholderiales bacterium]|nr:c-type cytochrome [Burkholderiales bacterium]